VVAAGHIQNRYEEGQMVRVGIVEGRIVDIGRASSSGVPVYSYISITPSLR
jgi:hypothetical protein